MKKAFKLFTLLFAAGAVLMTGCKKDEPDASSLEAKINSIEIANGGISGGDIIKGAVDNTAFTVTFDAVPAETNIAALKLNAKCSLGARLEESVIDLTKGNAPDATALTYDLKVINSVESKGKVVSNEQVYKLTVNLAPAKSAPILDKMVIKDEAGTEYTLTALNIIEGVADGILCLGIPESSTATIVSVQLSPARGTYNFTTAKDGVISASDPGMFETEFMGLKAQYAITFVASPAPGADWSKAIVHDFSINTNRYPDFDEEFTRGGDFDGTYVLLANRTAPKLFRIEDLLNDNTANPINLDITGIEGGTHVVSAGRLTQGHVYLCNLATAASDIEGGAGPLKVYHYATPTSQPEVVLTWDGSGLPNPNPELYEDPYLYTGRIGDNISISLDESGNGYAFFFKQEGDNKFFRWTVTNFTQFTDPTELALPAVSNYYGMLNPVGPDEYLFTSSYQSYMWLMDHDGNVKNEFEWVKTPDVHNSFHACDPRVIEFNRARYIMLSNSRRYEWWGWDNIGGAEGVNVYDISEGQDMVGALTKLDAKKEYDDEGDVVSLGVDPCYSYNMDSKTISEACVALCNCAVVNGKLVIFTAAPHSGFAIIEAPMAQ